MGRVDMLDPVVVVQHTVLGNTDPAFPQFIDIGTFHHFSKEEIHIGPDVIPAGFHLFCQGIVKNLMVVCQNTLRIQNRHLIIFLLIQFLIDLHGCAGIFRLYDQGKLVIRHIALYRVAPFFIPDI